LLNPRRALLTTFLMASTTVAGAQIAAQLRGRVFDASGATVPNARVELTQSSTNLRQSTLSTTTGDYVFINLAPCSYSLNVTAARFQSLERTGISVVTGQTVTAGLKDECRQRAVSIGMQDGAFLDGPAAADNPTPVEAMAYKLKTPEGKKLYALRKQTPEPGAIARRRTKK